MLDVVMENEKKDLRTELSGELKRAMKEKDQLTLSTVRLVLAAIKEKDILCRSLGTGEAVSENDILSMLQSMIKQREDSSKSYISGGREELAQREQDEIKVIRRFLPEQIGEGDLQKLVVGVIEEIGAGDIKDMGKVMGEIKSRYAGQVDMSQASALVKTELAGRAR